MHTRSKILLSSLAAALVLAAAVGTASARRLEISNTGIRAVFNEMTFSGGESVRVVCRVTLEGTLHSRTISKVSGQLVGFITRAIVGEAGCTGGTARVLPERLPWHVRYDSFTGALPNITAIRTQIIGAAFLVLVNTIFGRISCLYITRAEQPAFGTFQREAGGVVTAVNASGEISTATGFPCEAVGRGRLEGSGSVTLLGTTTRITVRLVQ